MSYSRWSDSDWYTFWLADAEADASGDPIFEMWHCRDESLPCARYSQLRDITEDALAALVPGAPRDDIDELLGYVREFCADVEAKAGGI